MKEESEEDSEEKTHLKRRKNSRLQGRLINLVSVQVFSLSILSQAFVDYCLLIGGCTV